MKKYKPKKLKKQQQEQRQSFLKLKEIVKNFSTEQWLLLIRTIDMKNIASLEEYQYKGEFLVLVADIALRLSRSDIEATYPKPSSDDLKNIISLYFSYDKSPLKLIEKLGIAAVPLMTGWQNKFHYPPANMLGRMHLLYADYHEDIEDMIGVTVMDLHVMVLAIYSMYAHKEFMYFKAEALHSAEVGSLSKEKVEKFLDFFAIDIDGYRSMAKLLRVYDNQVGKFNLLNRYPIIKIDKDRYIIPSRDQLLDSVAANLYHHILGYKQTLGKKVSGDYLSNFGITLENYVVDLAKNAFGDKNVVDANDVVTDRKADRCEVVCYYEDKTLALEVKKLYFQRDAVSEGDTEHIKDTFERHLSKGMKQIISTMKYVEGDKQGLIVIPDIMLSPSAALEHIKQSVPEFDAVENKILMCTLSEYEKLMANSCDIIFRVLDTAMQRGIHKGNDISLLIDDMKNSGEAVERVNPYISKTFVEKIRKQEEEYSSLIAYQAKQAGEKGEK